MTVAVRAPLGCCLGEAEPVDEVERAHPVARLVLRRSESGVVADGEPGPPQRLARVVAEGCRREDLRAGLQTEASQPVRERLPPQREEAMLRDGEGEGELRLG